MLWSVQYALSNLVVFGIILQNQVFQECTGPEFSIPQDHDASYVA